MHLRNDVLDSLLLVCLLHNAFEVSDSQPVCVSRCLSCSRVPLCNVYAPPNVWHYHITRLLLPSPFSLSPSPISRFLLIPCLLLSTFVDEICYIFRVFRSKRVHSTLKSFSLPPQTRWNSSPIGSRVHSASANRESKLAEAFAAKRASSFETSSATKCFSRNLLRFRFLAYRSDIIVISGKILRYKIRTVRTQNEKNKYRTETSKICI